MACLVIVPDIKIYLIRVAVEHRTQIMNLAGKPEIQRAAIHLPGKNIKVRIQPTIRSRQSCLRSDRRFTGYQQRHQDKVAAERGGPAEIAGGQYTLCQPVALRDTLD